MGGEERGNEWREGSAPNVEGRRQKSKTYVPPIGPGIDFTRRSLPVLFSRESGVSAELELGGGEGKRERTPSTHLGDTQLLNVAQALRLAMHAVDAVFLVFVDSRTRSKGSANAER